MLKKREMCKVCYGTKVIVKGGRCAECEKERQRVASKKRREEHPEETQRLRWMNAYKGTFDQWEDYRTATHCACCGIEFNEIHTKCQDHDHDTKEIRDVICNKCNAVEGMVKDNPEKLIHILRYMVKWKAKNITTQLEKTLETFSALFGTH